MKPCRMINKIYWIFPAAALALAAAAYPFLPEQLVSYWGMDDGADAPAAPGEAGDALTDAWQEAIGFPLVLDGWSYAVEEQKKGLTDGYYAFSLMRVTSDGSVTVRMDVPFGGYSYDSFELDSAVTVTRGDFTLKYEETRSPSVAGEELRARGVVERGGEPCIYVTGFDGFNVRFDETMFALLGVPEAD